MSPKVSYLIGGILIGGGVCSVISWLLTKKKYEKILEDKIQEMSDEVAKVDPFAPRSNKKEKTNEVKIVSDNKNVQKVSYDDVANLVKSSKSSVKTDVKRTDYTKSYDPSGDEIITKQETIFDLMKDVEEVEEDENEDDTTVEFHSRSDLHADPIVISSDEASELPNNYESETLFYYVPNDVLVDEYDDQIDEPGQLIGDLLDSTGFKKNLTRHLYIKNPRLSIIYDVQKVFNKWEGMEGGV